MYASPIRDTYDALGSVVVFAIFFARGPLKICSFIPLKFDSSGGYSAVFMMRLRTTCLLRTTSGGKQKTLLQMRVVLLT